MGAKQLLNHWGLSESNVMAFGDGDNDLELLQMAGPLLVLWKMPGQLFYKWPIRLLPTTKTKGY
ncbi:MAG: HAD hydrolase family protein [Streptococcus salivarius]